MSDNVQVQPHVLLVLSFAIRLGCMVDHIASPFLLSHLVNVSLKYN